MRTSDHTQTKERLLTCLKRHRQSWVSGESLSSDLGVSRSAVWKHIAGLRKEGYLIRSSPKKGYSLEEVPDLLLPAEIREKPTTRVFGRRDIVYLPQVDSTNTRAKELAGRGAPEGALVITEQQTGGRGRRGRTWFSPPGEAIYVSLILRPRITPVEAPKMTLMAGVAVAETLLSAISLEARIKWPNDILVGGKKIAGILTELSTEMDAINFVIVGLGLNVNIGAFPDELRGSATSVLLETGKRFPRVKLIREFLGWFEKYYAEFQRTGFAPLLARWKYLSDMIGKTVTVDVLGSRHRGEVHGIDEDGILILKDSRGDYHRIFSGEVLL